MNLLTYPYPYIIVSTIFVLITMAGLFLIFRVLEEARVSNMWLRDISIKLGKVDENIPTKHDLYLLLMIKEGEENK